MSETASRRRFLKSSGAIVAGTAIAGASNGDIALAGVINKGCGEGPGLALIRPDREPYRVDDAVYRSFRAAENCLNRARAQGRRVRAECEARARTRLSGGDAGFSAFDLALQDAALVAGSALSFSGWAPEYRSGTVGYSYADAEPTLTPGAPRVEVADPARMSAVVKRAARFLGADLVGVCRVDPRWLYSEVWLDDVGKSVPLELPGDYRFAVVLGLAMDYETVLTSPAAVGGAVTYLGYSRANAVVMSVAKFVRNLGYRAVASVNDTALSVPLAIDAGLGEFSRTGLVVTPQYGARVRLAKVITELPLKPDRPITFGVRQLCRKCKKCAQRCPASCIPTEAKPTWSGPSRSNNPGVLKWYVDVDKCLDFWLTNGTNCMSCIAACPYSKPSVLWFGGSGRRGTGSEATSWTRIPLDDNLRPAARTGKDSVSGGHDPDAWWTKDPPFAV